jgi:toxin YoeB
VRTIILTKKAFEEMMQWGITSIRIQQKIAALILDIFRTPFTGLGKPEPLKHGEYKGYWSRRITDEHRLVYKVTDEAIIIVACDAHYE